MNIQDWLAQLLARPAADPLDWESYRVTMERGTWTSLWREINATEMYEDGLEAGLRLLLATRQHRQQLGPRMYQANQILLYRSILSMLDKADRWETYLATWETLQAQTSECQTQKGDTLRAEGPRVAPYVRRADGGFGVPPLPYGVPPPATIAVHFLYPLLHRKTLIERKVAQARTGRPRSHGRPTGREALTTEEIQVRLAQIGESPG